MSSSLLAIDVGAGTQDILIYDPNKDMENCIQLVVPSRTKIVGEKVEEATRQGWDIFLTGSIMGGGPCVRAIKNHIKEGYKVFATEKAGKTIKDDLERVRSIGVEIVEQAPKEAMVIETRDIDLNAIRDSLSRFSAELPGKVAVAVQDHGESPPGMSNRRFRFEIWKRFIESGGAMSDLGYFDPPQYMTRMRAVQADVPGALVTDTGSAAIWGALCDLQVEEKAKEGVVIINIGNQHVLGALVSGFRVLGIFEHHTAVLDVAKLSRLISRFRAGTMTNDEIFEDHGHGCHISRDYIIDSKFDFVAVTGPKRNIARNLDFHFASPFGNMMLTGCFGLVKNFSFFDIEMPKI